MRYFLRFEDITTGIAQRLSIAFLIIAAALALYQVITRFAFGAPSTWSEVITRSAMIWSVFLGVAVAFKHSAMISVDVIQNALPPRLGIGVYLFANVGSLIFFAVLLWQGYLMTLRVIPQSLAALDVSIAWVYAALPVGSAFILVAIVASMVRAVQGDWLIARNAEDAE
jgi:TRAP-type C4-dicarboxylate transport system permease small subunit